MTVIVNVDWAIAMELAFPRFADINTSCPEKVQTANAGAQLFLHPDRSANYLTRLIIGSIITDLRSGPTSASASVGF